MSSSLKPRARSVPRSWFTLQSPRYPASRPTPRLLDFDDTASRSLEPTALVLGCMLNALASNGCVKEALQL